MNANQIERSLAAPTRSWPTVRGALAWYAEQRARRTGRAIDLGAVGVPVSVEAREQTEATYARVAACIVDRHPADEEGEHLGPMFETRVSMLLAWYASQRAQQRMADEQNMNLSALERWMGGVERIMRRRLRSCGVVEEWSV